MFDDGFVEISDQYFKGQNPHRFLISLKIKKFPCALLRAFLLELYRKRLTSLLNENNKGAFDQTAG